MPLIETAEEQIRKNEGNIEIDDVWHFLQIDEYIHICTQTFSYKGEWSVLFTDRH